MNSITEKLKNIIDDNKKDIEEWFAKQYEIDSTFFYSSVDLRHSGRKLVPVDTNIFPAGFNLLSKQERIQSVVAVKKYFAEYLPDFANGGKLMLIPENHTRNLYYLDHLYFLKEILRNAGFDVRLASLSFSAENAELISKSGYKINLQELSRDGDKVLIEKDNFVPDIVIVNNDFSAGSPDILYNITQPVLPPTGMGWYRRRKKHHFETYLELAKRFANKFSFDPWFISTISENCGKINFKEKSGLECVARAVERAIQKITQKYVQYGIEDKPYVFIKADAGTYGMGIMTVSSAEEVFAINKKNRNKMSSIKEGQINSEVVIQEGVPTIDIINNSPAEPMIYMIGNEVVGCNYRVNEASDNCSNLNKSGMIFVNAKESGIAQIQNHCPVHSLVAKLASLAAAKECYEESFII